MKTLLLALLITIWSDDEYPHFIELDNGNRVYGYVKQQDDSATCTVFKAYTLAPVDTSWSAIKDTEYILRGAAHAQFRASNTRIQFMYDYINSRL
jgi:hypothetical protein